MSHRQLLAPTGQAGKAAAGWLGALAVVVLTLGACGDDDDDADDASAAPIDAATLEGRTFVSTEVEGEALVDGTEITLTFDQERLSARPGCNTLFGGFEIDAGSLIADLKGRALQRVP